MPFLTTSEIAPRPFQSPVILHSLLQRKNGSMPQQRHIFLWYKNGTDELVQPVVNILKSLRINIYVDFEDHNNINGHPDNGAENILNQLAKADKLIFLVTPEADLKELTVVPAWFSRLITDTSRAAIFPLTNSPERWEKRNEFYNCAYINKKFSYINFPDDWQVQFPLGKAISLKDWILNPNN